MGQGGNAPGGGADPRHRRTAADGDAAAVRRGGAGRSRHPRAGQAAVLQQARHDRPDLRAAAADRLPAAAHRLLRTLLGAPDAPRQHQPDQELVPDADVAPVRRGAAPHPRDLAGQLGAASGCAGLRSLDRVPVPDGQAGDCLAARGRTPGAHRAGPARRPRCPFVHRRCGGLSQPGAREHRGAPPGSALARCRCCKSSTRTRATSGWSWSATAWAASSATMR